MYSVCACRFSSAGFYWQAHAKGSGLKHFFHGVEIGEELIFTSF
jgi:hypothetical protein